MSVIHELAEASRRGKIAYGPDIRRQQFLAKSTDWDFPSFDFGRLPFSRLSKVPQLTADKMAAIEARADELLNRDVVLPYPRCAFISIDPTDCTSVDVFEHISGGILCFSYYKIPKLRGQWFIDPVNYYFDNMITRAEPFFFEISPDDWRNQLKSNGNSEASWLSNIRHILRVGIAMLDMPSAQCQPNQSAYVTSVNRGREKADLAPIPETLTIHMGHVSCETSHSDTRHGVSPRPHDRRAHYRRLKSGRLVPVQACKIHGGGDFARNYQVVA